MPKIYDVYLEAMKEGKEKGVSSQDIRILIAHEMGYAAPIDTLYHKDDEFTQNEKFQKDFARLLKGEPVEYITNKATFLTDFIKHLHSVLAINFYVVSVFQN